MTYQKSKNILEKINSSENIFINVHVHPDYDSVSSALSMAKAIEKTGKKAEILCCEEIDRHFFFLKGAEKIRKVDYSKESFEKGLFIILDSSSYDRVTGSRDVFLPKKLEYVVIDHHRNNSFVCQDKIVDEEAPSVTEMLYRIFIDWDISIDSSLSTVLLTGLLGDTVFLRYAEDGKRAFKTASELIEKGADKDFIGEQFFERYRFESIRLLGEFLISMKKEKNFVWSALPYATFVKYKSPKGVREMAADLFFRGIEKTAFGVAILEYEKNKISISFRSKKNTDVSVISQIFGGGGHKNASGATITGDFPSVLKDILDKLRNIS